MSKISRRNFLGKSALGLGSALIASQLPFELSASEKSGLVKMPVGFQSWIVREKIGNDFPGTMKMVAEMGYESVELCSPLGYKDLGFGGLMKFSGNEVKKIVNDSGLKLASTHYGMDEMRKNLSDRIRWATDSGQKQMIVSSVGLPENATLSDWLKAAEELNKMGTEVKKAGLQLGYHNHHTEFKQLEGKLVYDELMKVLDKDLVKMQFQVAVISVGYKAADYFKKYPGRFISAHLADWSKELNKQVPVGQGIVDWKEFFATLKTAGIKNIFVEMDLETFKDSFTYLHNLK
jgi:sugar phosphate isomerase/epimerase